MDVGTLIQVLLCVIFYGGFLALGIEFWWKSRHEGKSRPNPAGDLEE